MVELKLVLTVEEKLDGREVWIVDVVVSVFKPVKLVVKEWPAVVDVSLVDFGVVLLLVRGVVLIGPPVECPLV